MCYMLRKQITENGDAAPPTDLIPLPALGYTPSVGIQASPPALLLTKFAQKRKPANLLIPCWTSGLIPSVGLAVEYRSTRPRSRIGGFTTIAGLILLCTQVTVIHGYQ